MKFISYDTTDKLARDALHAIAMRPLLKKNAVAKPNYSELLRRGADEIMAEYDESRDPWESSSDSSASDATDSSDEESADLAQESSCASNDVHGCDIASDCASAVAGGGLEDEAGVEESADSTQESSCASSDVHGNDFASDCASAVAGGGLEDEVGVCGVQSGRDASEGGDDEDLGAKESEGCDEVQEETWDDEENNGGPVMPDAVQRGSARESTRQDAQEPVEPASESPSVGSDTPKKGPEKAGESNFWFYLYTAFVILALVVLGCFGVYMMRSSGDSKNVQAKGGPRTAGDTDITGSGDNDTDHHADDGTDVQTDGGTNPEEPCVPEADAAVGGSDDGEELAAAEAAALAAAEKLETDKIAAAAAAKLEAERLKLAADAARADREAAAKAAKAEEDRLAAEAAVRQAEIDRRAAQEALAEAERRRAAEAELRNKNSQCGDDDAPDADAAGAPVEQEVTEAHSFTVNFQPCEGVDGPSFKLIFGKNDTMATVYRRWRASADKHEVCGSAVQLKHDDTDVAFDEAHVINSNMNLTYVIRESFENNQSLNYAAGAWCNGYSMREEVLKRYGHISIWDVRRVTRMVALFSNQGYFNEDISCWDVSNVISMRMMFERAERFNRDLPWNVSNVVNMSSMFEAADSFNRDLPWNVENVVDMTGMFAGAKSFNGEIGGWDVKNVVFMKKMFSETEAFNGDISKWQPHQAKNMSHMFANARSFNCDIQSWVTCIREDCKTKGMFAGATSLDSSFIPEQWKGDYWES